MQLNDIWATEIYLNQVTFNGDEYVAKYEVTLWDHFGLDKPDMEKFYYYGNGFRAWFLLQHLQGYKPFLTKMTFTQEFKGNINKGMAEINAQRKQLKEVEAQKEREKAERMIELWKGPKY
jgi:hypothetical protein